MEYKGKNRISQLLNLFERAGNAKRKTALLYAMVNDNKVTLTEFSHLMRIVEVDRQNKECTYGDKTNRR